ncbi:MAG: ABC transporter [Dehalococcoidia bacterium]|nr:MAG: ABC transporter [Dehalococcoidia bacterium]
MRDESRPRDSRDPSHHGAEPDDLQPRTATHAGLDRHVVGYSQEVFSVQVGKPIVTAHRLTKRFGTFTAVDAIDFRVNAGECVAFLGPNGAGKSSTMRMIYCASPVTEGELYVDGLDVKREARQVKSLIGVVPQESNLDPDLTVRNNLLTYARYFDIPKKVAEQRADEALALFQLTEKAKASVDTLSGGMQRRLTIARALINRPRLIVLDEPTTGLDPQARHLVWTKLRQLKDAGATMLLTTHYMEEAARLADRVIIMDRGTILAEGTPAALVETYVGHSVLELRIDREENGPLVEELAGWGIDFEATDDAVYVFERNGNAPAPKSAVREALRRPATLEDVFLRLAGRSLQE